MSLPAAKLLDSKHRFFQVRIHSVPSDIPLQYDVFLLVSGAPVLFRRRGDLLTEDRKKHLIEHGGQIFLIPDEQKALYHYSLRQMTQNPDIPTEVKAHFFKETAYCHVQDLFTKENIAEVVVDARALVEDMVSFISTDVKAVASLMGLSTHDYYTYNHCVDVSVYSIMLAKRLLGGDKTTLINAGMGGLLHDLGKRDVPVTIINKSGPPLTPEEWAEIKKHPGHGRKALEGNPTIPTEVLRVVHEHHENFEGNGYPQGLREDEISALARTVTIADVFDALTTDRSYHKSIPADEALEVMYKLQPGKFDPQFFKMFNKNFANRRVEAIAPFDPCLPPHQRK